jgi:hypothetical protein
VVSSLVPEQPADGEVHFVLCGFRSGPAYVETDPQAAASTDIVRNMIAGEYEHPLRVLAVDVAAHSVPPADDLPRWRITRIRKSPATELDTVEAPDAEAAIARYIEDHKITDPHEQRRLAARRVG